MLKNVLLLAVFLLITAFGYSQEEKLITPPEGKAMVYFIRSVNFGSLGKIYVGIDKKEVGTTKGNTYISAIVEPGSHTFYAQSEKLDEKVIQIEAGKSYYFFMKVFMGFWKVRCELEPIDEARAKTCLAECKLGKLAK